MNPNVLEWARERAGIPQNELVREFKKLREWENGDLQPTLKQAESFAHKVHVPLGYLFLSEPPDEQLPIPDFRTLEGRQVTRPSPNLLDIIRICQERQSWYRDFARASAQSEIEFIGSATVSNTPESIAKKMRETLAFGVAERRESLTWSEALRLFIRKTDEAGILVMASGIVLSNTYRSLDPEEFRGFALSDAFAPLIFINGADTKAAQMFTLAHELAHLWLGSTALSNMGTKPNSGFRREEVWCNTVAAEFLVPMREIERELMPQEDLPRALSRLARIFKVSSLVVLRRLLDADWIDRQRFDLAWAEEIERLRALATRSGGGGDFYRTTLSRVGHRFAQALVVSTLEGQTLYRDAYRMLGVAKSRTFNNLRDELGIPG